MKRTILLAGLLVFFCGTAVAQRRRPPGFEEYPVAGKFTGTPAVVDLRSHPKARLFRTMLREGAKRGPNFAGHYTVVTWGCGSDCRMVAVVDARTGRVYIAPFTVSPGIGEDFRIDSRLFIANPPERSGFKEGHPMFDAYKLGWHVWQRGRFVQVYPKERRCGIC